MVFWHIPHTGTTSFKFFMLLLSDDFCLLPADFFKINFFEKFSGIPSECQTDWIHIRTNTLCGLIWVQSVCKGYQETTLVGKELNAHADISRGARGLKFCSVTHPLEAMDWSVMLVRLEPAASWSLVKHSTSALLKKNRGMKLYKTPFI